MKTMMSETITGEAALLVYSFGLGVLLMMSYDVIRILRKLKKHGTIQMAIEDGCYWVICSLSTFVMLYQKNDGQIRWYVLAGITLGMCLENITISRIFVGISVKVLKKIMRLINKYTKPMVKVLKTRKNQLKKYTKAIKIGIYKL